MAVRRCVLLQAYSLSLGRLSFCRAKWATHMYFVAARVMCDRTVSLARKKESVERVVELLRLHERQERTVIEFWKSSASGSKSIDSSKDSSTLPFTVRLISLEKLIGKSLLHIRSNPDLESWSGLRLWTPDHDRISLGRAPRSPGALVSTDKLETPPFRFVVDSL